jgi:cardiolipin synthase
MTFEGDSAGIQLAEKLIQAQSRGIAVRVIIDYFSDYWINDTHCPNQKVAQEREDTQNLIDKMKQSGIPVQRSNPFGFMQSLFLFRNHKKLAIIDNSIYMGGINISDHNFSWHDFMVRFDNPSFLQEVLADFNNTFDSNKSVAWQNGNIATNQCIVSKFCKLVKDADEEIILSSPYILEPSLLERLCLVKEGVRVRILTNTKSNLNIYNLNRNYICHKLQKTGKVEILFYKRFSHAKFLIVDRQKALFGSSNFNLESALLKDEIGVLIDNEAFVQEFCQRLYLDQRDNLSEERVENSMLKLSGSFISSQVMHSFLLAYNTLLSRWAHHIIPTDDLLASRLQAPVSEGRTARSEAHRIL